ncbi:exodeoxyribonuclease V, alpha subunit, partial [Pseudomonas savastanoi pv. glycinea str. race 4]
AGSHDDLFALALKGEQDLKFERLVLDGLGRGEQGPQGYRHYLNVLAAERPA